MKFIFLFLFVVIYCSNVLAEHEFHITNYCTFPVYPGIVNNPGSILPMHGGFTLAPGQMTILHLPEGWSGRIWGRTNCDQMGNCQTGDCGGKMQCAGSGPTGPTTVAHFNLDGQYGHDHYELNLVDGANVPMQIWPALHHRGPDHFNCYITTFTSTIEPLCPLELSLFNRTGQVIACKSPCQAFGTDQHCCTGNYYSAREHCREGWMHLHQYLDTFKRICKDCRNVPFDNTTDTFYCKRTQRSGTHSLFNVRFCFPS